MTGMTLIVRNTSRLVAGFTAVFGIYVAATGHLSPGGGFAGGVVLAAAGVLVVLAFGGDYSRRLLSEAHCHAWDASGAMAFLLLAAGGYFLGGFFINFLAGTGEPYRLWSAGTVPLSNLAILIKVGAGLAGGFLALATFRRAMFGRED